MVILNLLIMFCLIFGGVGLAFKLKNTLDSSDNSRAINLILQRLDIDREPDFDKKVYRLERWKLDIKLYGCKLEMSRGGRSTKSNIFRFLIST